MKHKDTNLAPSIEFTCNCSPSVWWAGFCRGWPGAAAALGQQYLLRDCVKRRVEVMQIAEQVAERVAKLSVLLATATNEKLQSRSCSCGNADNGQQQGQRHCQ